MQQNQSLHEGNILKYFLKGTGKPMHFYYDTLEMSKQNFYYHLGKNVLEANFEKSIKDKFGFDFSKIKQDTVDKVESHAVNEDVSNYTTKRSGKKQVTIIGKNAVRLDADQHAEAFGDWKGLPMYNVPITASFVEVYRDENTYQPEYYLQDKRFRDCDFGAIIKGDSMHDEIRHGDFIACKEIVDKRFIVYGDIYYIVSTNGLETCKYINADRNNPDVLLLMAKNEKISTSPIPKEMIHKLYKVRGIVRSY